MTKPLTIYVNREDLEVILTHPWWLGPEQVRLSVPADEQQHYRKFVEVEDDEI